MRGETVACIATGPSLTRAQAQAAAHLPCIAVADAWEWAPWSEILYACDGRWWDWHRARWPSFAGRKITQDHDAAQKYGIEHIQSKPLPGFSFTPGIIHQGSNSGFQALNLAILMGARVIYLLGYDMRAIDGRTHCFGKHPGELQQESAFSHFVRAFHRAAPDLRKKGIQVFNCSKQSALKCFPFRPIDA